MTEPIVRTEAESASLEHGAAIVLDPLREFLDAEGLGSGELTATEIGDGHSNLSFLVSRGGERWVLRRPPRGPLAPSANDVIRESRVLGALGATPVPVPEVLARCESTAVIGSPFFVMTFVDGAAIANALPTELERPDGPELIGTAVIDALVHLHGADLEGSGLEAFGRPSGYLERQLRRFGALLEANATRPLPDLEFAAEWLAAHQPPETAASFVHGDYRLGNLLFSSSLQLAGVLDWEMATVGDPLADLGYLTATWAEAGDDFDNPMLANSLLTAQPGFPTRAELASRYAEETGRSLAHLGWYQTLAHWKCAIFLEGSFKRYRAGASSDPFFAQLDRGVPALGACARESIRRYELELA